MSGDPAALTLEELTRQVALLRERVSILEGIEPDERRELETAAGGHREGEA